MKKILSLLVSILCIASCSVIEDPEEITLVNIGTDYFLEVSQSLQTGPNSLRIDITSLDTDNCESSYIDHTYKALPHLIRVNLNDIVHPSPCIQQKGAIQSSIELPLEQWKYEMNILFKGIVQNDGSLEVTEDKFKLKLETENGIVVLRQEINIIPDGYIWGRLKIANVDDLNGVKNTIEEIRQNNSKSELSNGNYGYFEVDGNLVTLLTGESVSGITETFLLKQDQSFSDLQLYAARFSELHPEVAIELYSSEGASYFSK